MDVAVNSMKTAREAEALSSSKEIGVTCDGTWQRRSFSSKNGITTVLTNMGRDNGSKVIDTEVLTTYCPVCPQLSNENTKLSKVKKHDCIINHTGCAWKMETDDLVRIFSLSDHFSLRYNRYLGDDDSRSYQEVCKSNIHVYGPELLLQRKNAVNMCKRWELLLK